MQQKEKSNMTKNAEIIAIENKVLSGGYPVYQALGEIAIRSIVPGMDIVSASEREFRKLQDLNREWISTDRPCPARTSVLVCGGNYDFRHAIGEAFVLAGSTNVNSSFIDDYWFAAKPDGGFADYAGQPCVWFPEMTVKDLLRFCGRTQFLYVFEPYPSQPASVNVPRSHRLLHNKMNVVTTSQDFQTFVEGVNADGKKDLCDWERKAVGQITRRLPIVVNVLDDKGSCEILVHDELISKKNSDGTGYNKLFSVDVDQDGDLHLYREGEQKREILHTSCYGGDKYERYSTSMLGVATVLYRTLRRRR